MEKKEQTTQTQTEEKTQQEDQNIVEDYTKTLQRLQADFDNYRKKFDKEKEKQRQMEFQQTFAQDKEESGRMLGLQGMDRLAAIAEYIEDQP